MKQGISSHFSRESKIMILLFILPIVIGLAVAIFYPQIKRQIEIDSCLDSGGKFNYEETKCVK